MWRAFWGSSLRSLSMPMWHFLGTLSAITSRPRSMGLNWHQQMARQVTIALTAFSEGRLQRLWQSLQPRLPGMQGLAQLRDSFLAAAGQGRKGSSGSSPKGQRRR